MAIDRTTAWAELHDPATGSERLRAIAFEHPEFAESVVAHPNAYAELVDWLRSVTVGETPDPSVAVVDLRAELRDPATTAERLMEIAQEDPGLGEQIAAHPNAYPGLVDWLRRLDPRPAAGPAAEEPGLTAPDDEPLDLADRILIAAAAGAQAFDELGFVFAVQELATKHGVPDRIRALVRPDEALRLALPGILVLADRHDAIALFSDDRLILVWKSGGARSLVVPYADVTAARIGTAPSELAEVLALYLQAQETLVFAVPTDDPARADFLAHLVRGVPLAQIRPDLVDDDARPQMADTAETPELVAARAELADVAISGDRVSAIAAAHPELHVELAGHARAYPALLDWLESRPDPRTREAVVARRARDSGAVLLAPAAGVALSPVATAASVSGPNPIAGRSGWEHADRALDTADKIGNVAVNVAAVIYGIFLVVAGIAITAILFGAGNPAGFFGILVAIYGVYVALPLPGAKIIIW